MDGWWPPAPFPRTRTVTDFAAPNAGASLVPGRRDGRTGGVVVVVGGGWLGPEGRGSSAASQWAWDSEKKCFFPPTVVAVTLPWFPQSHAAVWLSSAFGSFFLLMFASCRMLLVGCFHREGWKVDTGKRAEWSVHEGLFPAI